MSTSSSNALAVLAALGLGVVASVMGTVMHQTKIQGEVPIGLFFSLSLVLFLAGGVRDRQRNKAPGFVFALTLAILVFLIGQNLTGDILIPANDAGLWWSYGSIAVAALVALWPKLKV